MRFKLSRLLLIVAIASVLLTPLATWLRCRPRVIAHGHLRRNERTFAMLETWEVPPADVLASYPPSSTIIGSVSRGPSWMQEILGVNILNARLVGSSVVDSDLHALAYFPELEYLELVDTNVSDTAVRELKDANPDLQLIRR